MQQMMQPMMQMQQMQMRMMAQMGAQMMTGCAMAMLGNPGHVAKAPGEEPEGSQRRMGQQVMANTMRAMRRSETQRGDVEDDAAEGGEEGVDDVAPGPSSSVNHP